MTLLGNSGGDGGSSTGSGDSNSGGTGGTGGSNTSGGTSSSSSGSGSQGSSSNGSSSWRDSLPEEMRANPTLSKYSDINSLAKAHVELQGFVGKKGIFPPGEKATPEQWKEFYKQAGQPDFEKFELKAPEGKKVNQPVVEGFKKLAHESGLMPHQAQGLMDWFIGHEEAAAGAKAKQEETERTQQIEGLKREWGAGFDKEVSGARMFAKEIGGDDFLAHLEKSGLGNDVQIVKMLAKASKLLGEDKLRGEDSGRMGGQTPAEIQSEINKVMGNPKHPYFDRAHPNHKNAIAEMESLYKKLTPQK